MSYYHPRDIRRYEDAPRKFTVTAHKDVLDPDVYRIKFGKTFRAIYKLGSELPCFLLAINSKWPAFSRRAAVVYI
jgi:hypothetical protein